VILPLLSILVEESCLLTLWCAGDRYDMADSDKDRDRRRRSGTEHRRWSNISRILSDRTIGSSGDAVCGLHRVQGDEEHKFLGLTLKLRAMVCQWFDLKITGTSLVI
jgi:hypothetical protein